MGLTHLRCSEEKTETLLNRMTNNAHAIAKILQIIHQSHMTGFYNVCTMYNYILLTRRQRHILIYFAAVTRYREKQQEKKCNNFLIVGKEPTELNDF